MPLRRSLISLSLLAALAAGCTSEGPSGSGGVDPTLSPGGAGETGVGTLAGEREATVSAPFDVAAVVRQVRLAFRPEGGAFVGGRPTYEVVADRAAVSIAPRHWIHRDDVEPEVLQGAPMALETVGIARGAALPLGTREMTIDDEGALVIDRGIARERFLNDEEGTQQTWRFETKPEGAGDLVVRVRTSGLEYWGETADGHHFVDTDTGLGVRYGRATWVSADGARTDVRVEYEAGELVLRVLMETVEESAYPAVLDPTVGPEFGVGTAVVGPVSAPDDVPSIAFDGTNFLLVWQDNRRNSNFDINATRVSTSGAVVDTYGFAVSETTGDQLAPQVAFNGTDYLVVWQDRRNSATTGADIYGARVTTSGAVSDPSGIAISTQAGDESQAAVSAVGSTWVASWTDLRTGTANVYAARVSAAGALLDAAGVALSAGVTVQRNPAVACDSANCLVVWQSGASTEEIHGARISSAGAVLDATPLIIGSAAGQQVNADVAYDGTANYLVAWNDFRAGTSNSDIFANRVTAAGAVLDTAAGFAVAMATGQQQVPDVAWDGSQFLVVWMDNRADAMFSDIYGARVATAGTVTDPAGIAINSQPNSQRFPTVAAGGGQFFVVWGDLRTGVSDLYGSRVTSSGTVTDTTGLLVATAASRTLAASVAFNGSYYFVAFADSRTDGNYNIYYVRVTTTGSVLDASGAVISEAANFQVAPQIVWNGSQFLVVWMDRRSGVDYNIYGARLSSTGTLLDSAGIAISTQAGDESFPAPAWNGTNYFVAWMDKRGGSVNDIYGARVSTAGAVLDASGIAVSTATGEQFRPDVASDGSNYLVVWGDQRSGANDDIYGARVDSSGTLLDASGVAISTAANKQQAAQVIWTGSEYFVIWADSRLGSTTSDVYAQRLSSTATLVSTEIALAANPAIAEARPALVLAGSIIVVVWRQEVTADNYDLYGARFDTTGGVVEAAFAISTDASSEDQPAVTSAGVSQVLVVYQRYDNSAMLRSERVKGRLLTFGAGGGSACTSDTQCASGHCSDGLCCNVACGDGSSTDCEACSVARGGTANGTCTTVQASASFTCRTSGGSCDVPETCNGTSTVCPVDTFRSSTTLCRGAVSSTCDVAEFCTGTSAACPADGFKPAGTLCRGAVASSCDAAEFCNGTSGTCPADGVKPAGTLCRGAVASSCDAPESCDGITKNCPPDTFKPAGTLCRGSQHPICDVAEFCTGTSSSCPPNVTSAPGTICRPSSAACDPAETCNTSNGTCPTDVEMCP